MAHRTPVEFTPSFPYSFRQLLFFEDATSSGIASGLGNLVAQCCMPQSILFLFFMGHDSLDIEAEGTTLIVCISVGSRPA